MTARFYLGVGLAVAAVVFGGWRLLLPGASSTSSEIASGVSSLLDTATSARFTGAEATLDAQRSATGSYAGAPLTPPIALVRASATSYCIELVQGPLARHVAGPGGTPQPGPC